MQSSKLHYSSTGWCWPDDGCYAHEEYRTVRSVGCEKARQEAMESDHLTSNARESSAKVVDKYISFENERKLPLIRAGHCLYIEFLLKTDTEAPKILLNLARISIYDFCFSKNSDSKQS